MAPSFFFPSALLFARNRVFDEDTLDRLNAIAEAERRDLSEIIRFACEQYVTNHKPKK